MRFYDVTSWSYVNLDDPIIKHILTLLAGIACCCTLTSTADICLVLVLLQFTYTIRPLLMRSMFLVTRLHVILIAASIGHYW